MGAEYKETKYSSALMKKQREKIAEFSVGKQKCSYVNKKHKLNRPKEKRLYYPTKSKLVRTKIVCVDSTTGKVHPLMDRAYEDETTCQDALDSGYVPVVPPKKNRKSSWEYDKELCKRGNEIKRYFRRLKRFRRVFTRYDKLDIVFLAVISFAMILDDVLM